MLSLPDEVAGTNVDATVETGEPDPTEEGSIPAPSGTAGRRAPHGPSASTRVTASSRRCSRSYTGDAVSSLTEVAGSPGFCGRRADRPRRAAGTTYHVRVAGFGDDAGAFALRLEQADPARQRRLRRRHGARDPRPGHGSNLDATTEAGEPDPIEDDGSQLRVYRFTALPRLCASARAAALPPSSPCTRRTVRSPRPPHPAPAHGLAVASPCGGTTYHVRCGYAGGSGRSR